MAFLFFKRPEGVIGIYAWEKMEIGSLENPQLFHQQISEVLTNRLRFGMNMLFIP